MNIFLDTTVTFADPFLKGNYNRNLLNLAKNYKDITFYMSEVVYKETKRHFELNVKNHLQYLYKTKRTLQKYKPENIDCFTNAEHKIVEKTKELLNDFESFYNEMKEENLLYILSCPDYILPEIIDRSVSRIKPFKEKKSEFRDTVTWLTYVNYVEHNSLQDCYFITENVTDFFDKDKENLHEDLLSDTTKFKPFINLKKLVQEDEKIKSYIEEKEKKERAISKWIDEQNIDEDFVLRYFEEPAINGLFNQIYHLCADYISSLESIKLDGVYYDGEPNLDGIDITSIQDFNIHVIAEEIIISGELIIEASCEVQELNKIDKELIYNNTPFTLELIQPFSFTLEMNEYKSIINLQFEETTSYAKPTIDPTIYF